MTIHDAKGALGAAALSLALLALGGCAPGGNGEIPVTTTSDDARVLYRDARQLADQLRTPDARAQYRRALAADPDLAMAYLGLYDTAATNTERFEALGRAVELAENVSDGERWLILAVDAGVRGDVAAEEEYFRKLIERYPDDARCRELFARVLYNKQDFQQAIDHLESAVEAAPEFPRAYNTMGYAFRATKLYGRAEDAFRRYIELIPEEPNPYDSYAEMLMKTGRFEESIENYRTALGKDPRFYASYIGIGHNQILMGDLTGARETFQHLHDNAHDDFERRQAILWTAASFIHGGDHERALQEIQRHYAVAEASADLTNMANDLIFMGDLFLETGSPARADTMYQEALATMERADVVDDVKEETRRNHLYREARVAMLLHDDALAHEKAEAYREQVEKRRIPAEMRRWHELVGRLALVDGQYDVALEALGKADQLDPEIIMLRATAAEAVGDPDLARELYESAATFNEINFNYAYVRGKAREVLDQG